MIEEAKRGQSKDLDNLKSRVSFALVKKKEIEERIVLLNNSFEKGEITYLEYKKLLENFRRLNKDYDVYITDCQEQISQGKIRVENNFIKNLPVVLILLLLGLVFLAPLIQEGGVTGLGFGIQEVVQNTTWDGLLADFSSGSAVSGDLNGDGWDDLVLSNGNVYINNGTTYNVDSSWGTVSSLTFASAALGDIDGDGDLDYIQFGSPNTYEAYENNGTALVSANWLSGFSPVPERASMALGDIDGDGDSDLVISFDDGGTYYTKVLLFSGTAFVENSSWQTNLEAVSDDSTGDRVVLADFDSDCDPDLILFGKKSSGEKIGFFYENTGTTFTRNVGWEGSLHRYSDAAVAIGDINNDGDLDLIVAGKSYDTTDSCDMSDVCIIYAPGSGVCGAGGPNICPDLVSFCIQDSDCDYCANVGIAQATPTCSVAYGGTDQNSDCWTCTIGGGQCTSNTSCWSEVYQSKVYDNAAGQLNDYQDILDLFGGAAVLGDIDNDGDLDLFLTGENSSGNPERAVYTNAAGIFSLSSPLTQTVSAYYRGVTSLFNDFDKDNILDLFVAGNLLNATDWCNQTNQICNQSDTCDNILTFTCVNNPTIPCTQNQECHFCSISGEYGCDPISCDQYTCVYSNFSCGGINSSCWADYASTDIYINNITTTNNLPSAPNIFYTNYTGGELVLNWSGASDLETATAGLYYNLRVGTTPGSDDVMSGYYPRSSNPTQGYFGNLMNKNFINLSLGERTYYWSVQTIDTAMGVSAWSTEQLYNYTLECGNKNNNILMAENLTVTNDTICFNITNDGITIDCDGYYFIGNGSGTAISLINQNNVVIQDCNFLNFTEDIVLENANNVLISNVDVIINITDSDGDNITNSDVEALYITNSTNIQIINSSVDNYTLDYVRNLTIENTTYGKVKFFDNVTEDGVSMDSDVIVGNNRVFVNSTGQPGWNVSAELTLRGLLWSGLKIVVSTGGNYTDCNATTSPACTVISYNRTTGVAEFNVSSFTTYKTKSNYTLDRGPGTGSINNVSRGSICVGDIDGDNDTDIFLNGNSTSGFVSEVYLNNGSGYFSFSSSWSTNIPGMYRSDCAMGDLNLDRTLDLGVCGQLANGTNVTYIYNNTGSTYVFWQALNDSGALCSISFGDIFPNDGFGDVESSGGGDNRFNGNDDGKSFSQKSGTGKEEDNVAGGKTVSNVDFDNDGISDNFVSGQKADSTAYGRVYTNDGDDTFTQTDDFTGPYPKFDYEITVNIADVNLDGNMDIIWSGWDSSGSIVNEVQLGDGDGTFTQKADSFPALASRWAVGFVNGDEYPDLVIDVDVESLGNGKAVWVGNGDGTFTEDNALYPGDNPLYNFLNGDEILSDFNGDGITDFAGFGDIITADYGPCNVAAPGTCVIGPNFCADTGYAPCFQDSDCNYCTALWWPGTSPSCSGGTDIECMILDKNSLIALGDNVEPNEPPDVSGMSCSVSYDGGSGLHQLDCSGATDLDNSVLAYIVDAYDISTGEELFTRSECGYGSDTMAYGCGVQTISNDGTSTTILNVGDRPIAGQIFVTDGISVSEPFDFYDAYIEVTGPNSLPSKSISSNIDCAVSSDQSKGLVPGETVWCSGGNWSTANKNVEFNVTSYTQKFNINMTVINTFEYSTIYAGFTNYTNGTSTGHVLADWWNLTANPQANGTFQIVRNFTGFQTVPFNTVHGDSIYWNESSGVKNITFVIEAFACNASTC